MPTQTKTVHLIQTLNLVISLNFQLSKLPIPISKLDQEGQGNNLKGKLRGANQMVPIFGQF